MAINVSMQNIISRVMITVVDIRQYVTEAAVIFGPCVGVKPWMRALRYGGKLRDS